MSKGPAESRIQPILKVLDRHHRDARCALRFSNPLELLVATVLSAQCTDVLVNKVTAELFKTYRTAEDYARADVSSLEQALRRVTFFRNKARHIKAACQILVERFGGKVSNRMEDLLELPGVARKTANVVLGNAFGIQAGVVVDTHMMRVSQRLGLTSQTDREKIEKDLMRLVPKRRWTRFGHQMIEHGRTICKARFPRCAECPLGEALCPSYTVAQRAAPAASARGGARRQQSAVSTAGVSRPATTRQPRKRLRSQAS